MSPDLPFFIIMLFFIFLQTNDFKDGKTQKVSKQDFRKRWQMLFKCRTEKICKNKLNISFDRLWKPALNQLLLLCQKVREKKTSNVFMCFLSIMCLFILTSRL